MFLPNDFKRDGLWISLAILVFFMLVSWCFAADIDDVNRDRAALLPQDVPFAYYFTTERVAPEQRELLAKSLAFAVASCNSKTVLEYQLPQQVGECVYRIDLRALGWESQLPAEIAKHYPYSLNPGVPVAMIRADWFIQYTYDQTASKGFYHRLLFGRDLKDSDDFLNLLGAVKASPYRFGWIEDNSGVANNGTRLLETIPTTQRTDLWYTYDFESINTTNDPLEHLDRNFAHDASEIIGGIPKTISSTGRTGLAQVYALANGKGDIQFVAPASIVTDHNGVRGAEIVNPVSCITCHEEGLRPTSTNALRKFLESGAEVYAKYEAKEAIESFHLSDIERYRVRGNEDYAEFVAACNGLTTKENAQAFHRVFTRYDADLSLEDCARELQSTPEELQFALAAYGKLPARLAQLAHGESVARKTWESEYYTAYVALKAWRARPK